MITLTFPDGNQRQFPKGTTGREVAASIAKSLEKKAVAMKLDGAVQDLADPIEADNPEVVRNRSAMMQQVRQHAECNDVGCGDNGGGSPAVVE